MVCFAIPRCFLNVFLQHQLFFTCSVLQIVRCNLHTCRESTSTFGFAQRTAGDLIMRHSSTLVFNIATNPHWFSDSSHEYWANFSCRKWNESALIFGFASRILGKSFHVQSETNPHWFSDSHHVDWVNLSSEKCCVQHFSGGRVACVFGETCTFLHHRFGVQEWNWKARRVRGCHCFSYHENLEGRPREQKTWKIVIFLIFSRGWRLWNRAKHLADVCERTCCASFTRFFTRAGNAIVDECFFSWKATFFNEQNVRKTFSNQICEKVFRIEKNMRKSIVRSWKILQTFLNACTFLILFAGI